MKIGEVYGNSNNKLLRSVSSSGKTLFIDFRKQEEFVTGMTLLEASINYRKRMSTCQTWLNVEKNTLISPKHSKNTNCSWVITSNFGSYIILDFKFIEVNSNSTRVIFVKSKLWIAK